MSFFYFKQIDNSYNPIYIVSQPRSGTTFLSKLLNESLLNTDNIIGPDYHIAEYNKFQRFSEHFEMPYYFLFLKKNNELFKFLIDYYQISNKLNDKDLKKIWFKSFLNLSFIKKNFSHYDENGIWFNKNIHKHIKDLILKNFFTSENHKKIIFSQYSYFPQYSKIFEYQLKEWNISFEDILEIILNNFGKKVKFIFLYRDLYEISASSLITYKTGINNIVGNKTKNIFLKSLLKDIIFNKDEILKIFKSVKLDDITINKFQKKIENLGLINIKIEFSDLINNPISCIKNMINNDFLLKKDYKEKINKINKLFIPTCRKENNEIINELKKEFYLK